jgi:hypothetical protein
MKRIWTTPIVRFLGTRGMILLFALTLATLGLVLHREDVAQHGYLAQAMLGQ